MKSEWKITCMDFDGERKYAVYRLRDVSRTDHSGNREYATGYLPTRADAENMIKRMEEE